MRLRNSWNKLKNWRLRKRRLKKRASTLSWDLAQDHLFATSNCTQWPLLRTWFNPSLWRLRANSSPMNSYVRFCKKIQVLWSSTKWSKVIFLCLSNANQCLTLLRVKRRLLKCRPLPIRLRHVKVFQHCWTRSTPWNQGPKEGPSATQGVLLKEWTTVEDALRWTRWIQLIKKMKSESPKTWTLVMR